MLVHRLITLLIAGLIAFHAVRTAAVREDASGIGATLWPSHPAVLLHYTMGEIGTHAARQQLITRDTLRRVDIIAAKVPLAPEPFLIKAALTQIEGKGDQAERLFIAARARDPRSRAARYFLAEHFLRTHRTREGLNEIAVLSRLLPSVAGSFAPSLAAYAQTRGAIPVLRRFFSENRDFEPVVLLELSQKAEHVDLVLALWSGRTAPQVPVPDWQASLVHRLIEAGYFPRAYRVWSRISGVDQPAGGIFNGEFGDKQAPPPFNWSFPNVGGVAEPEGNGRMRVLYFGRQDTVLAEQLLLLVQGQYQLGMEVIGGTGEQSAVTWTLRCVTGEQSVLELPIGSVRGRRNVQGRFTVPADCRAQRLQLAARAGEFARPTEFTIARLQLERLRS